jgi:hypothetical protein
VHIHGRLWQGVGMQSSEARLSLVERILLDNLERIEDWKRRGVWDAPWFRTEKESGERWLTTIEKIYEKYRNEQGNEFQS